MNLVRVVYIKFSNSSRKYSYICDDEDIKENDYVYVEGQDDKQFKVLSIGEIDLDAISYKLKSVISKVPEYEVKKPSKNGEWSVEIDGVRYDVDSDGYATLTVLEDGVWLDLNYSWYLGKKYIPKKIKYTEELLNVDFIHIDNDNEYFCYEDGILYDKAKTKVILARPKNKEVILPDTVRILGTNCFSYSDVEKVTITGDNIIIGAKAFEGCEYLEELNISGSLKTIGMEVFKYCSLSNININNFSADFMVATAGFAYSKMLKHDKVYYFSCNNNPYYFAFTVSANVKKIILHENNIYICGEMFERNSEIYLSNDKKITYVDYINNLWKED